MFANVPDSASLLAALDTREIVENLLLTLLLWAGAFGARWALLRALKSRNLGVEEQRRFLASTRSTVLVILLVGTAALWFDQLKIFALSLAAVSAALVLATKELIMCVGGTFLRTSSRSFEIGDRIEIGPFRGDVIDATLLSTTILEIGPGHVGHQRTGRAITVPSSMFLNTPLVNESFTDAYVLHTFSVVAPHDASWALREKALLEAATAEMAPYADESREFFERMSRTRGIETPTQEPRVLIQLADAYAMTLVCRLPTPARRKGRIEQAVLRRYLAATSSLAQATVPPQPSAPPATPSLH